MAHDDKLHMLGDALKRPLSDLDLIVHEGRGRLYRVRELGVAKVYERDSDKLNTAIYSARAIADSGIAISPRLLDVIEVGEHDVAAVFEYIRGMQPAPGFLASPALRSRLATMLHALHSIHADQFTQKPFDTAQGAPDWTTFVNSRLEKVCVRFRERTGTEPEPFFSEAMECTREAVAAAGEALLQIQPSLVHRDLTSSNLVLTGGRKLVLLDFDLAAYYDPFFDFVKLDLFNPYPSHRGWQALVDAYCHRTSTDVDEAHTRIEICRALELLWGYPALIATGSKAASTWKHQISQMVK